MCNQINNTLNGIEQVDNISEHTDYKFNSEDIMVGVMKYIEFDFNNRHYTINHYVPKDQNQRNGKYETHTFDDINQSTADQNLINQYFEIAATVDGEPLIYRLKEGVTFEDFVNAVNSATA